MCAVLIAGSLRPANISLLDACRDVVDSAFLLPPEVVYRRVRPRDVVLGRLDVLPTLDGIEPGLDRLRRLERSGVLVLNRAGTLYAAHDKLATARLLARAGLPHPRTLHARAGEPLPELDLPVVVKPRFGSWGADVFRCATVRELRRTLRSLARRRWFRRHGALVQEFVPTGGEDVRVIVAAGIVVGAIGRTARPGEWRTNVALGATRRPILPSREACALALDAAAAIEADFVGVDLLPTSDRYVVLELNGCVDFTDEYSLSGNDVFADVARSLLFPCEAWAQPPGGTGWRPFSTLPEFEAVRRGPDC